MSGIKHRLITQLLGASALLAALAGCNQNGGLVFPGGDTAAAPQSVELVEHDVEAPDVFQLTSQGLWDGRPSLGGVWVAHPDVTDPERVIIRNQANGKFVIGALFRRERETPGPALQVSSDAADALGMLAGAPATLNVTALRREQAAPAAPAATAEFDQPTDIAASTLDPIAGAAAAIDAAEAAQAPTATAPAPQSGAPAKPFIQIGIFSVEANATRTADRLRATGMVPTVLEQSSQGRTFWRVLVGPAATVADRADLLTRVKAQGFADAYFVTD
jgi:cell division septation protein DedD